MIYCILQHIKRYIAFGFDFIFSHICSAFRQDVRIVLIRLDPLIIIIIRYSLLLSTMFCVCIEIWASLFLDGTGRGDYSQLAKDRREIR